MDLITWTVEGSDGSAASAKRGEYRARRRKGCARPKSIKSGSPQSGCFVGNRSDLSEWQQLGDWRVSFANDDRALVATGPPVPTVGEGFPLPQIASPVLVGEGLCALPPIHRFPPELYKCTIKKPPLVARGGAERSEAEGIMLYIPSVSLWLPAPLDLQGEPFLSISSATPTPSLLATRF